MSDPPPRLLVLELWGIGDLALAIPFLRTAAHHARVTLVAKPHAEPILRRFAPGIQLVPFTAPWTAFDGKYQLARWPWREMRGLLKTLRHERFDLGVSARPDPRDHALLKLAGVKRRLGFSRAGSGVMLTDALYPQVATEVTRLAPTKEPVSSPRLPHRAEYWRSLANTLGWEIPRKDFAWHEHPRTGRRVVIHTGAAHAVRRWPRERYDIVAQKLRDANWDVTLVDDSLRDLDALMALLASADRFIGNDSGPGHLAALLGVPTFTVFGPQLPELFSPQHPQAAWVEGAPCEYKPCFDRCRFAEPYCLTRVSVDDVWSRLAVWLARDAAAS